MVFCDRDLYLTFIFVCFDSFNSFTVLLAVENLYMGDQRFNSV